MKFNKDIIYAFLVVLLISAFAYSVGNIFKENSEKQLSEIRKVQEYQKDEKKLSEQRENTANFKRDSALSVLGKQTSQISLMNRNFNSLNLNILDLKSKYDKNFNDLKNIQNEKDHVFDASITEQSDFISKYKYKEY